MNKKIGKFSICRDLIDEHPEAVLAVIAKVVIVRAETMWHGNAIEYIGYSEEFEEVEVGTTPPEYTVRALSNRDENEKLISVDIMFERRG